MLSPTEEQVLVPGRIATDDPDVGPGVQVANSLIPEKHLPAGYSRANPDKPCTLKLDEDHTIPPYAWIPLPPGECVKDVCFFCFKTMWLLCQNRLLFKYFLCVQDRAAKGEPIPWSSAALNEIKKRKRVEYQSILNRNVHLDPKGPQAKVDDGPEPRGKEENWNHLGEKLWTNVSGDGLESISSQCHIIGFVVGYGGAGLHNKAVTAKNTHRNHGVFGYNPQDLPAICRPPKGGWWDAEPRKQAVGKPDPGQPRTRSDSSG